MSEGYVIDTSALMQIHVQDSYTQNAHALIARLVQEDELDLHYLEIGLAESISVLWKHVKWGNIVHQAVKQTVADLQALPLIIYPIQRYLDGAFDLSVEHDLAVYDALYIVTAQHLNLPLIRSNPILPAKLVWQSSPSVISNLLSRKWITTALWLNTSDGEYDRCCH